MGGFTLDAVTVTEGARLLDAVSGSYPGGLGVSRVIGPSGAGKSTLHGCSTGERTPPRGGVLLDGKPIGEMDVPGLRRRVGLVAQRPVLLTDRVADELRVSRPRPFRRAVVGTAAAGGLPADFAARATAELSGGERSGCAWRVPWPVEPEVLLLDEPTSALDGLTAALIADLARDHVAGGGTVVLVSHDLAVVRRVAHHVLVLDHGRLVASGPPDQIDYLEAG